MKYEKVQRKINENFTTLFVMLSLRHNFRNKSETVLIYW